MTSLVNSFTIATLSSNSYDDLSTTIGLISIFLLLSLLILRELVGVVGSSRKDTWARTLNIAIVPLLIAFFEIVIVRLLILVYRYYTTSG